MDYIPSSADRVDEADIAAVGAALRQDGAGDVTAVAALEGALTAQLGVPHAVALSGISAAPHLACLALGVGPGDRVWLSAIGSVTVAAAALHAGASVDFVDVDSLTGLLEPGALELKLIDANRLGNTPKLVVASHFAGRSCDMSRIFSVASQYGVYVLEDAEHALGASFNGRLVGACGFSDATAIGFHSGGGAALLTPNAALTERLRLLSSNGVTCDPALLERKGMDAWYCEMQALGLEARMSGMQAALSLAQLKRTPEVVACRSEAAKRYAQLLANLPLRLPPDDGSAWHGYPVQLGEGEKTSRKKLFERLRAQQIGVDMQAFPLHLHPYFRRLGFRTGDFPHAEQLFLRSLSLPIFEDITEAQQAYIADALERSL